MFRATYAHIKSILFLEWRDNSMINQAQRDTGIGQGWVGIEYPPIGNLARLLPTGNDNRFNSASTHVAPLCDAAWSVGQVHLRQSRRKVSRTYLDMRFQTSLDLVTNSHRQNGSI